MAFTQISACLSFDRDGEEGKVIGQGGRGAMQGGLRPEGHQLGHAEGSG